MKPRVIMHTQVSVDGRIDGFENTEIYYSLSYRFNAGMVLFGSNTVATAFPKIPPEKTEDFNKPATLPNDTRPFGVIPDSRGRLRNLHALRSMGYLKDVIVLVSETTPQAYLGYLQERNYDYIVAGRDHVHYREVFAILHDRYGCQTIRTDSGGILTSILLEQGLIDEISLVIAPFLVGDPIPNLFRSLSLPQKVRLELFQSEVIEHNYLSVIYRVIN
jgi:2,5-diamino-6-(ribosylamino)-4(3H)-pyrimidinone 5'-phosphate reductase